MLIWPEKKLPSWNRYCAFWLSELRGPCIEIAPPVVRKLTKASSMVGKPCGWVSQPPSGLLAGAGEMKRLSLPK